MEPTTDWTTPARATPISSATAFARPNVDSGVIDDRDSPFEIPSFSSTRSQTVNAKAIARMNASQISEAEHCALLEERAHLLNQKFSSGLDTRQTNRLTYVRWSLDRIEDAKHGFALDRLEDVISHYENLSDKIDQLNRSLKNARAQNR